MNQLEVAIIDWFLARLPADEAVCEQLRTAKVAAREFTAGAGAFLTLQVAKAESVAPGDQRSYIDGPEIQSPEMTSGALATLHIERGVASSLEIWSYAGDYPHGEHPKVFVLVEPKMNLIDLRG
jgi:hypothetical protein